MICRDSVILITDQAVRGHSRPVHNDRRRLTPLNSRPSDGRCRLQRQPAAARCQRVHVPLPSSAEFVDVLWPKRRPLRVQSRHSTSLNAIGWLLCRADCSRERPRAAMCLKSTKHYTGNNQIYMRVSTVPRTSQVLSFL